ncbi:unnamed protein product [Amoebophrya sp. A120]|nr:unnamed protein product [Amoebophrya sp. A120]|eukprot:GSA120T00019486001.1
MSSSTSSPTSSPAPPPDLVPDASAEVFSRESSERTTRDDGRSRGSTSSTVNDANSSREAVLEEDSGRNSETSSSALPQLNDATISARSRPEGEVVGVAASGAKTTNGKQDERASLSGTATAHTSKSNRKKRDPNAWVNGRREQQEPDAAPALAAPPGADVHVVQQQEVLHGNDDVDDEGNSSEPSVSGTKEDEGFKWGKFWKSSSRQHLIQAEKRFLYDMHEYLEFNDVIVSLDGKQHLQLRGNRNHVISTEVNSAATSRHVSATSAGDVDHLDRLGTDDLDAFLRKAEESDNNCVDSGTTSATAKTRQKLLLRSGTIDVDAAGVEGAIINDPSRKRGTIDVESFNGDGVDDGTKNVDEQRVESTKSLPLGPDKENNWQLASIEINGTKFFQPPNRASNLSAMSGNSKNRNSDRGGVLTSACSSPRSSLASKAKKPDGERDSEVEVEKNRTNLHWMHSFTARPQNFSASAEQRMSTDARSNSSFLSSASSTSTSKGRVERSNFKHIVLCPGYGMGCATWGMVVPSLRQKFPDHFIHAIDWLGWGLSSRPKWTFFNKSKDDETTNASAGSMTKSAIRRKVDQAESFFIYSLEMWRQQILGPDTKIDILVGHSMGGYLSVCYAEKFPNHVTSLILASPCGIARMPNAEVRKQKMEERPWYAKLLLNTAYSLWENDFTPFEVVRFLGKPLGGKALVRAYVQKRFVDNGQFAKYSNTDKFIRGMDGDTDKACEVTGLPKGMSDRSGRSFTRENLGKYLYHCYAAEEGSAEYMISALLHPGAYAKRPLGERILKLQIQGGISFIYGYPNDWMDVKSSQRLLQFVKSPEILTRLDSSDELTENPHPISPEFVQRMKQSQVKLVKFKLNYETAREGGASGTLSAASEDVGQDSTTTKSPSSEAALTSNSTSAAKSTSMLPSAPDASYREGGVYFVNNAGHQLYVDNPAEFANVVYLAHSKPNLVRTVEEVP